MHFKRDRNPGAAAYEALVLHPCIPAPVPDCVFEITLLCFGTRARALPAEPPCRTVRGAGGGHPSFPAQCQVSRSKCVFIHLSCSLWRAHFGSFIPL